MMLENNTVDKRENLKVEEEKFESRKGEKNN